MENMDTKIWAVMNNHQPTVIAADRKICRDMIPQVWMRWHQRDKCKHVGKHKDGPNQLTRRARRSTRSLSRATRTLDVAAA